MKKSEIKTINIVAILAVFLFSGAGTFMNAAVQTMIEAWPQLSVTTVRMVTTIPSLVSMPVTILVGGLVGKKLSYRFCSIFGTALIMGAGVAPVLFHSNWILVLVFRALVGVGVGLIGVRNALILKSVPEDRQASVIGLGSALLNAGGMLAGPIVGALVVFGWHYAFLFDILALIPIILMILFLKEPANDEAEESNNVQLEKTSSAKEKMNWRVIYYIVAQFVMTAALYPLLSGMSTYMAYKGVGNAFAAGMSNAMYNLFGVLISIVLGPLVKRLGKHMLPVMSVLFSVGMAFVLFIPNIISIYIGAAIMGIAFNAMISIYQLYNGMEASPARAALTSGILIAALNLGNFMSVYYINLCHAIFRRGCDIESTYLGSMLLFIVFAVIAVLIKAAPREYEAKAE